MNKIYLCGKCTGITFEEMNRWREEMKEKATMLANSKCFNPCDYFGKEWIEKDLSFQEKLLNRDFYISALKSCNIVVANFKDIETSVGSIWEIALANELKIPIMAFNVPNKIHDWLEATISWKCDNLDDVIYYIGKYYSF